MQRKLLPVLTMLLAGLITCIICIIQRKETIESMTILFVVLLLFYIIGMIARTILNKVLAVDEAKQIITGEISKEDTNETTQDK